MDSIPKFPLGDIIEKFIDYTTDNFSDVTRAISNVTEIALEHLVDGMLFLHPVIVIAIITGLLYRFSGRRIAIGSAAGLLFILNLGLWEATMATLALVLTATVVSVLTGIPLGILAALFRPFNRVLMPLLDFMQTMPAFVYLIPAIPFFGLGPVSAIFTTVIFAMPPSIRLTCLGISQVPAELIEAADAFGSSRTQKLFKLQLPLATPTIMAGVNQTIMLALSMVVIAAMIGAGGLGGEVWRAIQRLWMGRGFEAGIAVVIIAMILDRVTQKMAIKK
jgi:glycine betaine/proline transport system permease protein